MLVILWKRNQNIRENWVSLKPKNEEIKFSLVSKMDDVEQDEAEQKEVTPTPDDKGGNDKWGGRKNDDCNDNNDVDNDEATKNQKMTSNQTESNEMVQLTEEEKSVALESKKKIKKKDKIVQVSMLQKVVLGMEETKEKLEKNLLLPHKNILVLLLYSPFSLVLFQKYIFVSRFTKKVVRDIEPGLH